MAQESIPGQGSRTYMPSRHLRAGGQGRCKGWVGHLPSYQENSCGGSMGPSEEILIQVI